MSETSEDSSNADKRLLLPTLTREIGIPVWEARQEVVETMHQIDALINAAPIRFATQQTPNGSSEIQHLPIGVLALITPLHLPFQSSAFFSVAALLSGNTLIHNPSKYAPGIGQAVADLGPLSIAPRRVQHGSGSWLRIWAAPDFQTPKLMAQSLLAHTR